MIITIKDNIINNFRNDFNQNPNKFATLLNSEQLKEYGVANTDFWKSFIINMDRDDNNDIIISNEGLYFYLAKIYFITYEDKKLYMLEKLPNNLKPNIEEVKIIAQQLEKQNIFVDIQSAVLIDEETKQYKFRKYKILKG